MCNENNLTIIRWLANFFFSWDVPPYQVGCMHLQQRRCIADFSLNQMALMIYRSGWSLLYVYYFKGNFDRVEWYKLLEIALNLHEMELKSAGKLFIAFFSNLLDSDTFRVENCQRSTDGSIFCETHFRRLFVAQNSYVFRHNQQFVITNWLLGQRCYHIVLNECSYTSGNNLFIL